jgi:hypothetical protein
MADDFAAQSLTTTEVAADGHRIRLNFIDTRARQASLTLPTDCVHQLIMTLPQLLSKALRAKTSDDSARAVFTLGAWRLEQAAKSEVYIFSLNTPDGFEVAFSVSAHELAEMSSAFERFKLLEKRRFTSLSS